MAAPLPTLRRIAPTAALLVAVAAAPLVLKGFVTFQITMALIYAIAIVGLNVLTGLSGQFSLGQSAFLALGGYGTAILMSSAELTYVESLPIVAVLCFAVGFLFGFPARRLEGIHLALATFALAVAVPQILKLTLVQPWTGGGQGLVLVRPDPPAALPIDPDLWWYYVVLASALAVYALTRNLARSRSGRALMAIRDNPIAARTMGVDVALYKPLAFGLSALYTGIAGSLGAVVTGFVAPDSYSFFLSVTILVGLVVGGVGWMPGAIVGGAFVLFVPNLAEYLSQGLSGAVYGAFLLLLVYVAPDGVRGLFAALPRLFARALPGRERRA